MVRLSIITLAFPAAVLGIYTCLMLLLQLV